MYSFPTSARRRPSYLSLSLLALRNAYCLRDAALCASIFVLQLIFLLSLSRSSSKASFSIPDVFKNVALAWNRTAEQDSSLDPKQRASVAYVWSMTACPTVEQVDAAAVLRHSIHENSRAKSKSRYGYDLYVLVPPQLRDCAEPLKKLGYRIHYSIPEEKSSWHDFPGADDVFLPLNSYTLDEYPIVVHTDLQSLVLQPMDDLFDRMMGNDHPLRFETETPIRENIEAYYTKQTMSNTTYTRFLILKPDKTVFYEMTSIARERGYALLPELLGYYYKGVRPGVAVELNHCHYNVQGPELCPGSMLEEVFSVQYVKEEHLPWRCDVEDEDEGADPSLLIRKWHEMRADLEDALAHPIKQGALRRRRRRNGRYNRDIFLGHCSAFGPEGYIPLTTKPGDQSETADLYIGDDIIADIYL